MIKIMNSRATIFAKSKEQPLLQWKWDLKAAFEKVVLFAQTASARDREKFDRYTVGQSPAKLAWLKIIKARCGVDSGVRGWLTIA